MINFGDNQNNPGPEMFCKCCQQIRDTILAPKVSSFLDPEEAKAHRRRINLQCEVKCSVCGSSDLEKLGVTA